jgi:DNA-binding CsgD family transcriptional regulator
MMKLVSYQKALEKAVSTLQLNQILTDYLAGFGISTFSFTYYSYYPNSHNKIKYDYCSPNFSLWHQHYLAEGYEDIDSTLDIVYQTTLPVFWDLHEQLKAAKTTREKQMRLDSIAFGAEKGISIPIHGPQEDFANFLIVQMRGEKCLADWYEKQHAFFVAAYYYYFFLQRRLLLAQTSHRKKLLNKREIQCLILIAKQCSVETMAKKLHITERTVNYHIQRLNKKLGTQNKYQSVIKAMQQGLIVL